MDEFLEVINPRAPVVGASEIEIAAPAEVVWEVLTALDGWPSWNPDVKSMTVYGEVAVGSMFRWKAGPGTIKAIIQRVERPRLIAWTGKTFGIKAIHRYRLESRGEGTFVRTDESYEGLIAGIFRRPLRKALDSTLASGLQHLKTEAERPPDDTR
jgi:uncharacterized protein YndB with AHSA1/START domain